VEAQDELEASIQQVNDAFKQQAVDAVYAGEQSSEKALDLAIALGVLTPEAATMRLEFARVATAMDDFAESQDFAALSAERQAKAIQGVIDGLYGTAEAATAAQTAQEKQAGQYDNIADVISRYDDTEFWKGKGGEISIGANTDPVGAAIDAAQGELLEFSETEYSTMVDANTDPAHEALGNLLSYLDEVTADRTINVDVNYGTGGSSGSTSAPGDPAFAMGGSMIVPPGYPGDSYPIWVTSGERVTVETIAQQKAGQPGSDGSGINITIHNEIGGGAALDVNELAEAQRGAVTQALVEVGLI
jgi:hypothetical protein